jgi:uncharacterized protein (DUF58 family)
MTSLTLSGLRARVAARSRDWARRRQGTDRGHAELTGKRIYILPTRAGLIYAGIVVLLLISSMNYSNNMGFALTFLLTGVGLVAMHHCQSNLSRLHVRLVDTESCFAGQQAGLRLQLRNTGITRRWQLQAGWRRHSEFCTDMDADSIVEVVLPLETRARGLLPAPRIAISSVFPLGLFRAWSWIHLDVAIVVWPQPAERAERTPAADHTADSHVTTANSGEDLSGVRDYQRGDSPRRIDWKGLARHGDLRVREYTDGSASKAWIDWNDIGAAGTERRLSLMTRLVLDADAEGTDYGLRLPGTTINPAHGDTHKRECLNALATYGLGNTGRRK